jgi:hypothetical protein
MRLPVSVSKTQMHLIISPKIGIASLSLLLGVLLLVLSVPRIIAEILMLPGNRVLAMMHDANRPSDKELALFIASRQRSLPWSGSARLRTDLGSAHLLQLRNIAGGGPRYQEEMAEGRDMLREGLARAPGNPYAWTKLAYASVLDQAPPSRVVPLLEMAIRTAPFELPLTFARTLLCFVEWDYFPASTRPILNEQLRLAWGQSADEIIRLARATGRIDALREALPEQERATLDQRLKTADPR